MQLQGGGRGLGGEHPGTGPQHPRALRAAAGQHAGIVGQEHDRQVERVGHHDEVRRLVRGVGVDGTGQHLRLVGHHRNRMVAQMRQGADDRAAEPRLDLEPVGPVEDDVEHRAHVVDAAVVARHDVEQFGRGP